MKWPSQSQWQDSFWTFRRQHLATCLALCLIATHGIFFGSLRLHTPGMLPCESIKLERKSKSTLHNFTAQWKDSSSVCVHSDSKTQVIKDEQFKCRVDSKCNCWTVVDQKPSAFGGTDGEVLVLKSLALSTLVLIAFRFAVLAFRIRACGTLDWSTASMRNISHLGSFVACWSKHTETGFVRKRLLHARWSLRLTLFYCFVALAWRLFQLMPYLARGDHNDWIETYLYDSELVVLFCIALCITPLDVMPQLIAPTTLDCLNVLLSGMWAWRYVCLGPWYYEFNQVWMMAFRAFMSTICGNASLSIFLHCGVTAVDIYTRSVHFSQHEPGSEWFGYLSVDSEQRIRSYATRQFLLLLMICFSAWAWERAMLSEARALRQAKQSNRSSTLVTRLLNVMCEAVVHLDADLHVTQPCAQLAGLLLLHPCGKLPMLGHKFADHVTPVDRDRFNDHMASFTKTPDPSRPTDEMAAVVLHLQLCDANGGRVRVEIFTSCIPDDDGQHCYVVGVREEGIREEMPLTTMNGSAPPSGEFSLWSLSEDSPAGFAHNYEQSTSSASSGGHESSQLTEVWVDVASANLDFLHCSQSFTMLGGPLSASRGLAEWLTPASIRAFHAWLAAAVQYPAGTHKTYLRPPSLAPKGGYSAQCELILDRPFPFLLESDQIRPQGIILKEVKFHSLRRTRRAETWISGQSSIGSSCSSLPSETSNSEVSALTPSVSMSALAMISAPQVLIGVIPPFKIRRVGRSPFVASPAGGEGTDQLCPSLFERSVFGSRGAVVGEGFDNYMPPQVRFGRWLERCVNRAIDNDQGLVDYFGPLISDAPGEQDNGLTFSTLVEVTIPDPETFRGDEDSEDAVDLQRWSVCLRFYTAAYRQSLSEKRYDQIVAI